MSGEADLPVAATLAATLLVVAAISVWAYRRTRTAQDFFVAGDGVGPLALGLATTTAAFSGFVFVGGPGLTYRLGATAFLICLPVGFTGTLLCWIAGDPLWRAARESGAMTVPDAIAARFGEGAPRGLAAIAVLAGSVAYLGTQLLALGIVMESVVGWPLGATLAVGTAFVLAYALAGGMIAGVYTDLFQGALMIAAAIAVTASALGAVSEPGAMIDAIRASPRFGEEFLDPFATPRLVTAAAFLFLFGIGPLGQPHMLHKLFMLKERRSMRALPFVIGWSQSLCIAVWISVGLAVPALVAAERMAPLDRADDAMPLFLSGFAPTWITALAFSALVAAAMSTADSLANVAAAAASRDLPRAFGFRPRRQLALGRLAVLVVVPAAALLAWAYDDLVALLGSLAFGLFAAALAPIFTLAYRWRSVTRRGACASMATGLAATLILDRTVSIPGLAPAAALALSFLVLIASSWLSRRNAGD